jgi:hypothetical protein
VPETIRVKDCDSGIVGSKFGGAVPKTVAEEKAGFHGKSLAVDGDKFGSVKNECRFPFEAFDVASRIVADFDVMSAAAVKALAYFYVVKSYLILHFGLQEKCTPYFYPSLIPLSINRGLFLCTVVERAGGRNTAKAPVLSSPYLIGFCQCQATPIRAN